jgi:hypothetical protein
MASIVLTYAEFISDGRFAPFKAQPETTVQPAIDAAHRMWDEASCGKLFKDVVTYQTAVLLSTGYGGAPASKTRTLTDTPYDKILAQLSRGCVGTGIVLSVQCP